MKKRITVFTPTYNRAYILGKLYESLKRQRFTDFEWLIIDDGSTDNTSDLVCAWQKEILSFELRYYWTENGGKHRAVNKGLDYAQGEIFFAVDSDDYLTDDALIKIDKWFKDIAKDSTIVGIVANRGINDIRTENYLFSEKYLDLTFLEALAYREDGKAVLGGEKAIAFYTDFHKRYRYPEFCDERFATEAIVYYRMAHDGFKMRYFNDIIWVFKYHDDGLTNKGSELYIQNPKGYGLFLKERAGFLKTPLQKKVRMWYSFYCEMTFCDEQYRLTKKQIAEYIGAPLPAICCAAAIHSIWSLVKRKNSE